MEIEGIGKVSRSQDVIKTDYQSNYGKTSQLEQTDPKPVEATVQVGTGETGQDAKQQEQQSGFGKKDPSASTIDSVVSSANNKLTSTRCEYSYDEETRRVSIKVFDKESDELIREVPPEKSLEMLQRVMELAGLMVDEKR